MLAALASVLLATAPQSLPRPLPTLVREPRIDGVLSDLSPATSLKLPRAAPGATAGLTVKAAFRQTTLYVGVTVTDDVVLPEDRLDLSLFFPESGTTSRGIIFRFGSEGLRPPPADVGAPAWAQALIKAASRPDARGYTLELAIPARALPRFQAFQPLVLSLCADYSDVDVEGANSGATLLSTCPSGDMVGGPTRLPDELRKALKLAPTSDIEGLEARATGWVGYSKLHSASWVCADDELTSQSLGELVLGQAALEPSAVALPIPAQLVLPDERRVYTVLSGQNPFANRDRCRDDAELRLAMYVVKGKTAVRVLEWPAATCRLGRAMRFELTGEGNLLIGYTNGGTAHFTWTNEHFERSELGLAP